MSDQNDIADYLAEGGKLSAPDNAPPRYRAELMRMMASFVDSELAGAAGFADCINMGPGVKERIAASRIVLEKHDHAERVLGIMGEFGANTDRYMQVHPWTERRARDEDIGAERPGGDMRLNVFWYPIEGWADAVSMNVLMGKATIVQLEDLAHCSYQPLAEVFRDILPRERRHMELGEEGIARLQETPGDSAAVAASLDYWRPRVSASFGGEESKRFAMLKRLGLRHRSNAELRTDWERAIESLGKSSVS